VISLSTHYQISEPCESKAWQIRQL